jgi:twitching motility protein PilT
VAELNDLLQHLVAPGASDLHVKVGSPPFVRMDGRLVATSCAPLTPGELELMAAAVLPADKLREFQATHEVDVAHSVPGVGRFRVNVHRQRGSVGLVIRRVPPGRPTFQDLGLPDMVRQLAEETSGLLLIGGPPGSGRTTTAAAMVAHVNATRVASIVTIEDPIEVLHTDERSLVSQREVGADTPTMAEGMRRMLRHDPDVIYLSGLPDAETVSAALVAARTGTLVISTVDTVTTTDAIRRLADFFPHSEHRQVRQTLGSCLRGVVCQRLLERVDGRGRVPATEVMVGTTRVLDLVADPDRSPYELEMALAEGQYQGMHTFDQSVLALCLDGVVGVREALAAATRPDDLRLELHAAGVAAL